MMLFLSKFKSTVLLSFLVLAACGNEPKQDSKETDKNALISAEKSNDSIIVAANRTSEYLPLLEGKKVGIVANQTSVIFKKVGFTHLVDSLLSSEINVLKVFAPEHGFRGESDAGEKVKDGIDTQTNLPINSLYG